MELGEVGHSRQSKERLSLRGIHVHAMFRTGQATPVVST